MAVGRSSSGIARRVGCRRGYCFFSGVIGVTGCDPPVDFGPGVTPALLSVEPFELLVAVVSVFGLTPFVGPLPASSVDTAPFVGPLFLRPPLMTVSNAFAASLPSLRC
jgi:hypothetical protein